MYAFEVSERGISWAMRGAKRGQAPELQYRAFSGPVLEVSPVKDNVLDAEGLSDHVKSLISLNGRRRDAALILPDYCARVAILDFDSFPSEQSEQLSLVRFRLKKTVPFDMDAAAVNFQVQKTADKRVEVLAAAAAYEIVAKYEAPFRAAGMTPGFSTPSTLATMDLMPTAGLSVLAKLCGHTLTVAVCDGRHPKLVRCVDLADGTVVEVMSVIFPTIAFAEDELKRRPERLLACGFGERLEDLQQASVTDLGLTAEPLRTLWGPAQEHNAGLLGWLQAQEMSR